MGLYTTIDNITNKSVFTYVAILIILLFLYKNINIGLNTLLAIAIAIVVIIYIQDKKDTLASEEQAEINIQLDSIVPKPEKFEGRTDIINFCFSIQDMYVFNPLTYEEMVDNIDAFLTIYDDIFKDVMYSDYFYQIAESKKENAVNALQAMIFSLPDDKKLVDKLNRAHKRLETILNRYLNEMYDKCDEIIIKKGYDVEKRAILLGPKEANHYSDQDFTFQFY